jgi:GxxExxY protein
VEFAAKTRGVPLAEIIHRDLSFAVVGAAIEVHRILGPGFLEAVYQAAFSHEMTLRQIRFGSFKKLPVSYKGVLVGEYEADFVVEDAIILEIKAVSTLHPKYEAQAIHYLTATGFRLAILVNFGAGSLQHKRIVK